MFLVNKISKSIELSYISCDFNKLTYKDIDIYCEINGVQINVKDYIDYISYIGCVDYAGCVSYADCVSCASYIDFIDFIDYKRYK